MQVPGPAQIKVVVKSSVESAFSAANQPAKKYRHLLAVVLLLCLLVSLSGCTKRPLTRPTPQMDIEPRFLIRVLLLNNTTSCVLRICSPFHVFDAKKPASKVSFSRYSVPISVTITDGKITVAGRCFLGNEVTILPESPHMFNLDGNDYRGKVKLILNADGDSFDVMNVVPLESYLAGVIGAEMPAYWEPAALQAQTIAARTYCLYIKKHFGYKRNWDVRKTQANQAYHGLRAESSRIWNAVNETKGQVLTYKVEDGPQDIFPTYYGSTCGGYTENSQHVFGGDFFEPLAGVPCDYCKKVAKPSVFFWPVAKFDTDEITSRLLRKYPNLEKLGTIADIIVIGQSDYGKFSRLTTIKLVGSTGKSDSLRAEDFRLSIDSTGLILRSTICKIMRVDDKWVFSSGRGYGHGVGMCQCGAEAMARQGKSDKEILSYYYPKSKIRNVYGL